MQHTQDASTSQPVTFSTEQRSALIEAMYRRALQSGDPAVMDPIRMARIAMLTDPELLAQLLQYEADGDDEVASALAWAGLSERPVTLELLARAQHDEAAAVAIAVRLSADRLRRYEVDHFTVRDLTDFASLALELAAGECTFSGPATSELRPLSAVAILTNGPGQEPLIAFQLEAARPGRLDAVFRTEPMPLSVLRDELPEAIGGAETLSFLPTLAPGDSRAEAFPAAARRAQRQA